MAGALTHTSPGATSAPWSVIAPILGVVFVAFIVIGLAIPVLPLHVHEGLGLGTFAVGLVSGSQFVASLVSRPWAGGYADRHGVKRAVVVGLGAAAGAGLSYLLSLQLTVTPILSAVFLLAGRAVLGGAESCIITGALSWALALVDSRHTGKVIAWVGTAMFAAFAVGAPAGATIYEHLGFVALAVATIAAPLLTLLVVLPLKPAAASSGARASPRQVFGAIWVPGVGLALASTGFGAVIAFTSLLFAARGWTPTWTAFTSYAVAFIAARVAFGHFADRFGGARVALGCLLIEAAGQALVWMASNQAVALFGIALTGFGFSLVYPGFGVEAARRVPVQSRGLAMGAYAAFLDLAIGVGSPLLGWIAGLAGLASVFLFSALSILCAVFFAARLLPRHQAR